MEPSGHGTYNTRWRKEQRRKAAVARQAALCESPAAARFLEKHGRLPLDWRLMLPASEREKD